jgi:hypothetical protein
MHQTVKSWLRSTHLISKEWGYRGKFEINELGYEWNTKSTYARKLRLICVNSDKKTHLQNTRQDTTELNIKQLFHLKQSKGQSWSWSYDGWIYIYLCNHNAYHH